MKEGEGTEKDTPPVAGGGPVLDYPVVGIGASAGGIDALRKFFASVPANTGMAFVVVLHLHPDHESHLADVLRKGAKLPPVEVKRDTPLERDHIYVIAPSSSLTIKGGVLRIGPAGERPRHPVDTLLRSMAGEQREKAVAIILSGSGSNGASGVVRIKEEGGVVFVQDPQTAEHQSMPLAAIGAGVADRVLPPEAMAKELIAYAAHSYVRAPAEAATLQDDEEPQLNAILALLRTRGGYDFRGYKTKTQLRRIRRRMGLTQIEHMSAYAARLRDDPDEIEALVRDLLITVTAFFRDREAWDALEKFVVRPLIREREGDRPLRVWVPACSSGEEAYSIAMLLLEHAEAAQKQLDVKVFATDAAPHVLHRARAGRFAASVAEEMPEERLARFFEREGDFYRAKKQLRESIMFAPQNLMTDPPFSRMDVVSCRNLLIYLDPESQKRVTALLHFSLREGGYLFLGTAETVGEHEHMFQTVSKKWRIFRRIGPTRHDIVDFPLSDPTQRQPHPPLSLTRLPGAAERARLALLDHFAPPSVLIDEHFRILYFHGSTERFLRQPRGEPTQDLLHLVRDGLAPRVRAVAHRALAERKPVIVDARVLRGSDQLVRLVVTPLHESDQEPPRLLVSFTEANPAPDEGKLSLSSEGMPDTEAELESALRASRLELRDTIEQLEGSNEELKASNEEITSMNEELQSTNEELETSKEELQSLNEELNTVNVQLQSKLVELEERTNDLNNLLKSSAIATLFLDAEMRIRWSTPAVRELLEVMPSDVGRPVTHLAHKFDDPHFMEDARAVLQSLQPVEREIEGGDGRWFARRTLPYRTEDNRIDGVVITFVDITERKRGELELARAKEFAERIVETLRQPLLVLDPALKVVSANDAFYQAYALRRDETIGRKIYEVARGQWDLPKLRRLLEEILPADDTLEDFEVEADFGPLGRRVMLLNARRLDDLRLILLAIEDVTERRRSERRQQALLDELQHRVKNLFANIRSLLNLSQRRSDSVDDFVSAFAERLAALERTQNLFAQQEYYGGIDLHDLVSAELEAHGDYDPGRIRIEGNSLLIDRKSAQALGMVVHELATNGLKYGALAHGGRLDISWATIDGGRGVLFRWRESGVPRPEQPAETGFGSQLIREMVPYMLGGRSELELTDDGVRCSVEFPLGQPPATAEEA